jgi:hypothetical protein
MLYMALMMPLGTLYFTIAVTGLSVSLSLIAASLMTALTAMGVPMFEGHYQFGPFAPALWQVPLILAVGVVGLFVTLHVARLIGIVHGTLAKHLLVKTAQHN